MNNISIPKVYKVIFLAFLPVIIALLGGIQVVSAQVPEISAYPASAVTSTTATFSGVVFDTGNTSTTAWFEYGTSPSSLNRTVGLSGVYQKPENRTIKVKNLEPDTTYYYRFVAENQEGSTRSPRYEFKTLVSDVATEPTTLVYQSNGINTGAGTGLFSGNTSSTTGNQSNTNSGTNGSSTNTNESNSSSDSNSDDNQSNTIDYSKQDVVGESKYSRLSIENGVETVFSGESFTYRVVYHNKTNKDFESAKLVVTIPEGFEILSFSQGVHEPKSSVVTVQLGTIGAKSTDEVTILVRANSASENYVVATAELTAIVDDNQFVDTVRARDVDAYGLGSLGLGASAAGSGVGQTIFIFIIIAIVFIVLVVGSRIVMKKRLEQKKVEYNPEDLN